MVVAIATEKRGRPCFVPRVNAVYDRRLQFYDLFYGICASFHYREIMGWSRFLGVHPFTVERWKYRMSFPKDDVAQQIIEWDKEGRPWEKVEAWNGTSNMLGGRR